MRIKVILAGTLMGLVMLLGGCSFMEAGTDTQESTQAQVTGIITTTPGIYDSQDTALVVQKNTENMTIQFQNLATGKRYTLTYDGATQLLDKYDQSVALGQIQEGSIVTVRFYKPKKTLAYLKIPQDSMTYEDLNNYVLDTAAQTLTIGDTSYSLSNHLVVISDGQEAELMDINQMDVLDGAGNDWVDAARMKLSLTARRKLESVVEEATAFAKSSAVLGPISRPIHPSGISF